MSVNLCTSNDDLQTVALLERCISKNLKYVANVFSCFFDKNASNFEIIIHVRDIFFEMYFSNKIETLSILKNLANVLNVV